ncbi:MAG TPA: hypothetical protein VFZ61_34645, partial [Polyangiales bacterium]
HVRRALRSSQQEGTMSELSRSAAYIQHAVGALPAALRQASAVPLPRLAQPARRVLSTGIGLSEAPARLLASQLADRGVCARFCVTSQVAEHGRPDDLLVVFSQGLSPNAQLALGDAPNVGTRWLVTSVEPGSATSAQAEFLASCLARGVHPIVIPPPAEAGALVRMVGPTVAALLALRLAASLGADEELTRRLHEVPDRYRALPLELALDDSALGLIAVGMHPEWVHAHRWKLLETLLRDDPPIWEALQFAHGPLQAYYERRLTLLVFEAGGRSPLVERIQATLQPGRHRLVRISSALPPPLAFFEHAATLDTLLLHAVQASGRDLFDWPARDADGPLYDLGNL